MQDNKERLHELCITCDITDTSSFARDTVHAAQDIPITRGGSDAHNATCQHENRSDSEDQDIHAEDTDHEESYSDPDEDPALMCYTEDEVGHFRLQGLDFFPDGGYWYKGGSCLFWPSRARGVVFEDSDGDCE